MRLVSCVHQTGSLVVDTLVTSFQAVLLSDTTGTCDKVILIILCAIIH